jgi:hypothetical protein
MPIAPPWRNVLPRQITSTFCLFFGAIQLASIPRYEDTFETPIATVVTLVRGDFVSGSAVYRSLSCTEIFLLYCTVAILGDLATGPGTEVYFLTCAPATAFG